MAEQFESISEELRRFIDAQKIFFVGSAARDGRVNVSPKGQDSLKVVGPNELIWLNLTGSGNETAAHLRDTNRITLMWCAFEGPPRILRVYGSAITVHPRDPDWPRCAALIEPPVGARQYFRISVELVQTSCGYAVPFFDYREERVALTRWAEKKGDKGIADYWRDRNTISLDGLSTGILEQPVNGE